MIESFWRLSIKQTLEDGELISDWDDIPTRFSSLQDLVSWFADFGEGVPIVGSDCILITKRDAVITEGRAFFLKEDTADMQDYSKLIEKGAVKPA